VKIDRFTGGTIDTALFDEEPVVGGRVGFDVEIRNPEAAEVALLLMAARDLLDGLMTLGGEASVGRGRLCGSIQAILPDHVGVVTFDRAGVPSQPALLQPYLDALIPQEEATHA
jgi:CRISPR/Cas system CSM-associated protein Csm3 (group 7 of RAMP superfamily)